MFEHVAHGQRGVAGPGQATPATASPAAARTSHAPSIATELHDLLDRLLSADLSGLTADEHSALLGRLLRGEHRLHAATLDAVAAFDTADVAATTRHRTTKRWIELATRTSTATASQLARSARALRDHLPATRDALARGLVSPQHVSAAVSVVSTIGAEHAVAAEPILLDLAPPVPTRGRAGGRRTHPPDRRPRLRGESPARRV